MKRRLAREIAIQSLYHLEMNEMSPNIAVEAIIREALNDNEAGLEVTGEISEAYVLQLVEGTLENILRIDELLTHYLKGWEMERLSKVDREILRLAAYEMIYSADVPSKVAVNEAVELAKNFGTEESGKFVNGVLGVMIKELPSIREKEGISNPVGGE